ncbi:hypothetical protein AQJ43_30745 [Streptomyces avermitilis]|uniref:Uncharacterized protein n=2 Tax=Streptomyces avermitilis TaxID=33903 RepID=Q82L11_STRAW|nr:MULTISPECIES: hypothetical protein [Streptomyces]KUN50852.1 hypothetical protein AQJ43_30745 [Streptomyces avermitilis]MYS97818.1 hypothetical protein [Streptomyces sp. SID5469]OOV24215.1 hypothetical protein SM007_30890 [Streptomyces avermitilis]BAC69912.1 hypothetical protein SAVERM_2201 [Streptomyces avermitilis MA-4680 = NBRC 14893]BBJ49969.1 hypothetical protein SAVMC3_25980 [Streptomyces avermitilis]
MLSGFVTDVGRKLAERWAATLVLPGLLFTTVAAVALTLRQSAWSDVDLLRLRVTALTGAGSGAGPGAGSGSTRTAVLLLGVLAASFAAALVADALGGPYEQALLGSWPRLLSRPAAALTGRRRRIWQERDDACRRAVAQDTEGAAERAARLGALEVLRNQVALTRPECPTWIGDRLRAPAVRIRLEYRLELSDAWPRLWLVLPDSTRQPLAEARQRLDEAMRLGGWAVLYLLLGAVWWPSAVAGAGAALVAWRRGRDRAEEYAELVESAVDVHLQELFERFDEEARPVRASLGPAVTERFRKGAGPRRP